MFRFKYDALSEKLLWYNRFSAYDDEEMGSSSDDDYDGYLDEDEVDEDEYDENDYDDSDYEGEYDDEDYDGEEYEDEDAYDDEDEYDEGEYDDGDEYDDSEEYEDDYDDDEVYGEDEGEYEDDEYDDEDLGYDPNVFKRLNRESSDEYDDEDEYEEEEYGDDGEYSDDNLDEYEDEGEEFDETLQDGWLGKIKTALDNDYVQYALCALIPLLALYLIWKNRRFDNRKKWILTGIAGICLIIWMIICWPWKGSGSNDNTIGAAGNSTNLFNELSPSATSDLQFGVDETGDNANTDETPTTEPSPSPTAHVTAGGTTGGTTTAATDLVWSTNANPYYHTISDCGGMTGASSMTLETALQRGKTACPECAGGTNQYADQVTATTYYATSGGRWYHTNPSCQGMTGASVVTESAAIQAGKTACPVCIGYYGTERGTWYHSISNCQGMQNAVTKTEAEWKALGKTACPTCLGSGNTVKTTSTPTETQVYCTTTGTYFHTLSDCTGMKGASQVAISRAVSNGKKACPRCVSPSRVYVFATDGGKNYHTKANCSGMSGAKYVTAKVAINAGKTACAKCNAKNLTSSSASADTNTTGGTTTVSTTNKTTGSTALANGKTTTETATYVYATKNGTYYHTNDSCTGMKNASRVTYAQAISAGKKACPTCVTASKVKVFATSGGKYYHTKSTCTGMKDAVQVTIAQATSAGKTACPTCAKALGTATTTKSSSAAANSQGGSSSGATSTNTVTPSSTPKATATTIVYITTGSGSGSYYHKAAKCAAQNFSNGTNVTLEFALGRGYKACPSCNPPSKVST